jgi:hypothetical protein
MRRIVPAWLVLVVGCGGSEEQRPAPARAVRPRPVAIERPHVVPMHATRMLRTDDATSPRPREPKRRSSGRAEVAATEPAP